MYAHHILCLFIIYSLSKPCQIGFYLRCKIDTAFVATSNLNHTGFQSTILKLSSLFRKHQQLPPLLPDAFQPPPTPTNKKKHPDISFFRFFLYVASQFSIVLISLSLFHSESLPVFKTLVITSTSSYPNSNPKSSTVYLPSSCLQCDRHYAEAGDPPRVYRVHSPELTICT